MSFLSSKPSSKTINNYKLYRNDRTLGQRGGVAIAVRNNIKHKAIEPYRTQHIENVSIAVQLNNIETILTAAYNPKYHHDFGADIKILTPVHKQYIIFGDFIIKQVIH